MKTISHLKTISYHKYLVMQGCFKVGLIRQGLTHDLSKYTPAEFLVGARYYQGNRSPNAAEREDIGYSTAWMHHKGRNRHHYEYWTDLNKETGRYESVPMPRKYLVEMVMDRIAACKVYRGSEYNSGDPLAYLNRSVERKLLHPETLRQLERILTILRDKGEDTAFCFIRNVVLPGKDF